MTRKGQLTVTGSQQDESGQELTTVTTASAEYYARDGVHYILYEETSEDTEGITKNYIKLKDGLLELTRKGAVSARMIFQPGQEHATLYSTSYGTLPLGILTDTVESVFQEDMIQICAAYTLTSQGTPVSKSKINIKIVFKD